MDTGELSLPLNPAPEEEIQDYLHELKTKIGDDPLVTPVYNVKKDIDILEAATQGMNVASVAGNRTITPGQVALTGLAGKKQYTMPPLPPTMATLNAFRLLLLQRRALARQSKAVKSARERKRAERRKKNPQATETYVPLPASESVCIKKETETAPEQGANSDMAMAPSGQSASISSASAAAGPTRPEIANNSIGHSESALISGLPDNPTQSLNPQINTQMDQSINNVPNPATDSSQVNTVVNSSQKDDAAATNNSTAAATSNASLVPARQSSKTSTKNCPQKELTKEEVKQLADMVCKLQQEVTGDSSLGKKKKVIVMHKSHAGALPQVTADKPVVKELVLARGMTQKLRVQLVDDPKYGRMLLNSLRMQEEAKKKKQKAKANATQAKKKQQTPSLVEKLRGLHEYRQLQARFRSLFLWPALLSTISQDESLNMGTEPDDAKYSEMLEATDTPSTSRGNKAVPDSTNRCR